MNCFYFPDLTNTDRFIELGGNEVRHIAGSRRLKVGDVLCLFNGDGLVADVEISGISKHQINVNVNNVKLLKPAGPRITLVSAIPKGDRINTLLDMSTQLGMSDFIPLDCERSVVKANANKYERFHRICINACKQSRRFFVPKIHSSITLSELVINYKDSNSLIIAADPQGQLVSSVDLLGMGKDLVLLVGPEGGFSESELKLLSHYNILKLKLTDAILRVETACVSLLSHINYRQMS